MNTEGHIFTAPPGVSRDIEGFTLGIRPEYVQVAQANEVGALAATVQQAQDIGTYWLVSARVGAGAAQSLVRMRLPVGQAIPKVGETVWLALIGPHTCFYADERLIEEATA